MANKLVSDDINTINYILEQIGICTQFITNMNLNEFLSDIKTCYAVSMNLQVICENANHITNKTKNMSKKIEWDKMSGLRNLISHDYGKIMFEDMYHTVVNDLPTLQSELEQLLKKIDKL